MFKSGHAPMVFGGIYNRQRNVARGYYDEDHLRAAATWLARAQDVMTDGGVCGRYRLRTGWTSSYPETTGYIIPTLIALAKRLEEPCWCDRAERCVDFLLRLQFHSGAFPGLEVSESCQEPSFFNTAQIVHGLVAWQRRTGDERVLRALCRAGDWLVSSQDDDGAFRANLYHDTPTTYSAHATCWLAELGQYIGETRYLDAARRHLDWVLTHWDPKTGWIDMCGFDDEEHSARIATTHTIAYTLYGAYITSDILGREDGISAVRWAADRMARRLELSGWLPAVVDHRWRPMSDYTCLTGNAQMSILWLGLYEREEDARLLNAALKAIDLVKQAQVMDNPNPDLNGAVAGSDPVWGEYIEMALPSWAVKFHIDALLGKGKVMARIAERRMSSWRIPTDIATTPRRAQGVPRPLSVVLYTSERSSKPCKMLKAWAEWGFRPTCIFVEQDPIPAFTRRLMARVRDEGMSPIVRKLWSRDGPARNDPSSPELLDPYTLASELNIPIVDVDSLSSAGGVAAVAVYQPDIAVHAGAGILRSALLALPSLGTLNAHMGVLPRYRGMNVAEWAAFNGDPVGCTVHLIDRGIDTGRIICARVLDVSGIGSIAALRACVDEQQIELLGEVLRTILVSGDLPPTRSQACSEGRQYFAMHSEVRATLEKELRDSIPRRR